MSRVFTRAEFYDLVWSKPMTHLAKEFALSDVALHKICKKHDIPNPPLGWWAKKVAGKAVKQTPLPKAKAGTSDKITIAAGELRPEPELIAAARENARLLASSIDGDAALPANSIVDRTIAQLRKAKPSSTNGLVTVEGLNVIKVSIAPASIDRLELALGRIAAAAEALGIKLVRGEKSASFQCEGETIGFSISEGVRREKHDRSLARRWRYTPIRIGVRRTKQRGGRRSVTDRSQRCSWRCRWGRRPEARRLHWRQKSIRLWPQRPAGHPPPSAR